MTAWDPEKGSAAGATGIYGVLYALGVFVFLSGFPLWARVGLLLAGWAGIGAVFRVISAAAVYTLTTSELSRRSRGQVETLPLSELKRVEGYYKVRVGPCMAIQGRQGVGFELNINPGTTPLFHELGRLLVAAGQDRAVIADERTRRALGIAGGGLRDPWQPPSPKDD